MKGTERIIAIIPARFQSSRFPGKPLVNILGKSLIQRTYESTLACKALDDVVVATDDKRIFDHVLDFGGNVVMTSSSCPTGTDRLAEAIKNNPRFDSASIIINVQGDEPLIEESVIHKLIEPFKENPLEVMTTVITPIKIQEDLFNPSIVKCVVDKLGYAIYFSRNLIPFTKTGTIKEGFPYYRHIGAYGFRREFLLHYASLSQTPLQTIEDLEHLKVIEHGFRIKVTIANETGIGVDNPEDIQKVEQRLCNQNTYS